MPAANEKINKTTSKKLSSEMPSEVNRERLHQEATEKEATSEDVVVSMDWDSIVSQHNHSRSPISSWTCCIRNNLFSREYTLSHEFFVLLFA